MNEMTKTVLLGSIALLVVGLAFFTRPEAATVDPSQEMGKKLVKFPVEAAKKMRIVKYDEKQGELHDFAVAQKDNLWAIPSKFDYPADAQRQMTEAATSCNDLEILLVASDRASDHEKFGVIDPLSSGLTAGDEGVGTRVTIENEKEKNLADLIIGEEVKDSIGQHYVRRANQDVTYIIKINPEIFSTRFSDWIEKDLLQMNPIDLSDITFHDYSVQREVTPAGELKVAVDNKSKFTVQYIPPTGNWIIHSIALFDYSKKAFMPAPTFMKEGEQLKKETLGEMRDALQELKIVDVEKKPEALIQNIQDYENFVKNQESVQSLIIKGFIPTADKEGKLKILSTNGEIICTMKNGVEYVLRFGEFAHDSNTGEANDTNEDKDADVKDRDQIHRYLFVMARFNEEVIQEPTYSKLPPLPEDTEKGESKIDKADEATKEVPAAPKEDAANTTSGNSVPSSETQDKEEITPEEDKNDTAPSSEGASASNSLFRFASQPSGTDEKSSEDKDEEDTKSQEEEPASNDKNSEKNETDTQEKEAEPEPTSETTENKSTANDNMPNESTPESRKKSQELAQAYAVREMVKRFNQQKKDQYEQQIADGKKKVKELNERFGDWYYIIDNSIYKKIRLSLKDVIEKKPTGEKKEEASRFGQPGGSIPGLPSIPGFENK